MNHSRIRNQELEIRKFFIISLFSLVYIGALRVKKISLKFLDDILLLGAGFMDPHIAQLKGFFFKYQLRKNHKKNLHQMVEDDRSRNISLRKGWKFYFRRKCQVCPRDCCCSASVKFSTISQY